MKRSKKLFALLASLCLVLSMGTAVANAADTPEALFTKTANERFAGATRYDTSIATADALKASLGVSQFEAVVLAYGGNFPDALAGGYLANVKNAPVITVDTTAASEAKVEAYLKSNLKSNGDVYILGGTGVVTTRFEKALKADGYSVERLAGANRYDTNLKTLEAAGKSDRGLIICSGNGYADSLSASAVDMPILLVNTSITADQKAFIDSYDPAKIYIVGGTGVVSTAIENSLASKYDVKRVAGANRYKTSVAVAEEFFDEDAIDTVTFAYAQNFPDGLSGGPLAASLGAPMILTETANHADAKAFRKDSAAYQSVTFGGTALISDAAVDDIMYNYMTTKQTHDELQSGEYLIIDVRKAEDYATSHIWNSYSAPVNMSDLTAQSSVDNLDAVIDRVDIDKYDGVIIVCYSGNRYAKAATAVLGKMGADPRMIYTLKGGKAQWDKDYANDVAKSYTSTSNFDFLNGISVEQVKKDMAGDRELTVIDVRDAKSYVAGHIPGAISAALCDENKNAYSAEACKDIMEEAIGIDENGLFAIVCYSGNSYVDRARTALEALGIPEEQIISVEDGQKAWNEAGYDKATYNFISPAIMECELGTETVLLDVRAAADYETSHVAGSVSASCNSVVQSKPVTAEDGVAAENIAAAVEKYGTDAVYSLICYSGNRYATVAAGLLIEEGVNPNNIFILGDKNEMQSKDGGMNGWTAEFPQYITKSYVSSSGFVFKNGITVSQLKADVDGDKIYTVLDVRDAASYKDGHVPGAISVPLADSTKQPYSDEVNKQKLTSQVENNPSGLFVIVCYSGNSYVDRARRLLKELGVEEQQIISLEDGQKAWNEAGYDKATYNYVNAGDVFDAITDDDVVILDTRAAADYKTAHIPGAVSASCNTIVQAKPVTAEDGDAVQNINAAVEKYGIDSTYYIICYSGNRYANVATDLLIDKGVDAENIKTLGGDNRAQSSNGGMKAWTATFPNYVVKSYTSTKGFDFMNGITAENLEADVEGDQIFTIVDLRTADLYNAAHIPGAVSAVQRDVTDEVAEANITEVVDNAVAGTKYVLVCYSGNNFAEKARQTMMTKLGVDEKDIIVLEDGQGAWTGETKAIDSSRTLVDADWLETAQAGGFDNLDPDNLVVACVTYSADAKNASTAEVIPGAINVNNLEVEDADGLAPSTEGEYSSWNAAYNLLDVDTIRANCVANGITADTTVVVYGTSTGSVGRQALGYLFAGVKDVKMLCYGNGLKSWKAEGKGTETGYSVLPAASSFGTPAAGCEKYVDTMMDVQKELYGEDGTGDNYKTSSFKLVSIRTEAEFNGESSGYGYMCRAGEPEGAVFGDDDFINSETGRIMSLDELKAGVWSNVNFATDGSQHLSFYCGTGWRATVPLLICLDAGITNVSVYDGGWYEWSMDTVVDFNEGRETGASKVHTPLHPDNRVQVGSTICTVKDLPTNKSTKN